jgi:hypothetical protein
MRVQKFYIIWWVFAWSLSAMAADYRFITPYTFDQKMDVHLAGKTRSYYVLTDDKTVQVKVKGPTKLRVVSRAVLATGQDSVEYSFVGRREGAQKSILVQHHSRVFDNGNLGGEGGGTLTASRDHFIDVPRGEQTYVFSVPRNSKQTVLVRFARASNEFAQGDKIVGMTPISYTTRVDIVTKEETSAYYRVGGKDNVTLKLIGPATLKVLNRIEFDQNMNGKQKWRVQVVEDGNVKATHSFSAQKSQVTTYRESAPYVPSRAEAFFIEVPEGSHEYGFRLPDNHRTVLFRYLMPEKQLGKD